MKQFADQSFQEIRQKCLENGILFEDPIFKPTIESIDPK